MELELVKSLRRNLKRHQKEEKEEGFRWEMWQKAKLRNLQKYRKENKEIIDKISPEVEKIVEEALQSSYRTGQNIFGKVIQRIKTLFFKKKRVIFPKDISHHKLATPPPQEDNFFGVNKNKLQALQEEAEKVLPESKKDSHESEHAMERETKVGESKTESKKDQPEPQQEEATQEAEPFKPDGKALPINRTTNDIKLDNTKEKIVHDLKKVQVAVWRRMDDVYRQTVYKAEMNLAAGAKTLEQAIDMATKEFLQKGIDCIEYKDGKRVNIASYAEMALRTAAHRAKLLGEGKKRDEWGIHTVFVSAHANTCPLCAPWQGKILIDDVFSHGTKEKDDRLGYPLLSTAIKAGLLHPNCRHNIATYFPGITQLPKVPDTKKAVETYKAEQEQRELERQIKKWKRSAEGFQAPVNAKYAKEKVKKYQNKMREHLEKHPELRRSYRREKTRGIPGNPKSFRASGGRLERGTAEWNLRRDDEAENYYVTVRSRNDDVELISRNTGWSKVKINKIKQHVFFNLHILDRGKARYDADYNMAVAWKRLIAGEFLDRDLLLLKHEYLESGLEKKYNLIYREAHEITQAKYDWDSALMKEVGTYGEPDNLYEID